MEELFFAALAAAADNPTLQAQLVAPAAGFLKSKLPGVADKALGDLLCKLGQALGGSC